MGEKPNLGVQIIFKKFKFRNIGRSKFGRSKFVCPPK